MDIKIGSYIKIICQNGVIEAGKLIEHTERQLVLELLDKSFVIIQKPYDHIVAIKVSSNESTSRGSEGVFLDVEPEPDKYYRKEDLRAKNMAELHKLKAQEERNRAVELLRSHQPKEFQEVNFGTPNFSKPISHNSPKKVRRRTQ
jgi:hypothetical protein